MLLLQTGSRIPERSKHISDRKHFDSVNISNRQEEEEEEEEYCSLIIKLN